MNIIENKKKYSLTDTEVEEYMINIIEKQIGSIKINNKQIKKEDEKNILTVENYTDIIKYNYNLATLKKIAKNYKLKISGTKKELTNRIYIFLYFSSYAKKIQKIFRGYLLRNLNKCFGPAFKNKKICTNNTDCITMDSIYDIEYPQFFSYKDVDGLIYGFDISSLYNLILKKNANKKILNNGVNPYNRNEIPSEVINKIKMIIKLSKILKINVSVDYDNGLGKITNEKNVEMRALTLFQTIDSLGNYSSPNWFLSLSNLQLVKFIRELNDIWNYRAQLPYEVKKNICPPLGEPFRNINLASITLNDNLTIKQMILDIIEKFVNTGVDNDSKSLGAYYVLGALTLVNDSAASSLPWLYQSVSYF